VLRTATRTKLGIALEASELESITLKERKLEIVLILEEQIQLVLTKVRDKVSRSSIYTAKILLEIPMLRYYWKLQCWKVNYTAKILLEIPMLESWLHSPIKESFALSLLLSRPWHLAMISNEPHGQWRNTTNNRWRECPSCNTSTKVMKNKCEFLSCTSKTNE
jgi:hypothetical protein